MPSGPTASPDARSSSRARRRRAPTTSRSGKARCGRRSRTRSTASTRAEPGAARRVAALGRGGLLGGVAVGGGRAMDRRLRSTHCSSGRSGEPSRDERHPAAGLGGRRGGRRGRGLGARASRDGRCSRSSPSAGAGGARDHRGGRGNGVAAGAGSVWVTARQARRGGEHRPGLGSRGVDPGRRRADGRVRQPGRRLGRQQRSPARSPGSTRATGRVVATVRCPEATEPDRSGRRSVWVTFLGGAAETATSPAPPARDDGLGLPTKRGAAGAAGGGERACRGSGVFSRVPSQRTSGISTSRLASMRSV